MICKNCETEIEENSGICPNCGMEIKKLKSNEVAVVENADNKSAKINEANLSIRRFFNIPGILGTKLWIWAATIILALITAAVIAFVIAPNINKTSISNVAQVKQNSNYVTDQKKESDTVAPKQTTVIEKDNGKNNTDEAPIELSLVPDSFPVTMVVTGDELLVREGPGQEYSAVSKLYIGAEVKVLGISGDWAQIDYNGTEKWCSLSYLTRGNSDELNAIRNFDVFPEYIKTGVGCSPSLLSRDDTYSYYVVSGGGGWWYVKVLKNPPYTVQYFDATEKWGYDPIYEERYGWTNNNAGTGYDAAQTQIDVVIANCGCTANGMFGKECEIVCELVHSGINYDYYQISCNSHPAAPNTVEITKTAPYTIDRVGPDYAFNGPNGWGYR